jgi:hypothetical protein
MTIESALRFLDHEAQLCRERIPCDRDAHEIFCLLLPALRRAFDLAPMDSFEAGTVRKEFKELLNQKNCARGNDLALNKK